MIDIKDIREKPEFYKKNIKKRGFEEKKIEKLLSLDISWRKLKKDVDSLRSRRNQISEEINSAKKQGNSISSFIKEAKEIPLNLKSKEKKLDEIEKERMSLWKNIPNILSEDVPIGGAEKNKVLKTFGKISDKIPKLGHAEIMEKYNLIDTEKAAQISASRFYYLKNELVKLNFALINFAMDFLSKKGLKLIQTPYMLNRNALEGAITLDLFEEAIYKIENEDLYLIGTAEHAINAFKSNEIIPNKDLPLRFGGFSTSFRKEAGSHGKDTKGIFRVHQFEKIEQFVFCKPEDSWKEFDFILKNSIEIYKALGIPFRVVLLSSKETSKTSTKTIDLEGWYPSQKKYCELGSCSNCLDYQARRSNIRYQEGNELRYVNTINNTAIATQRMMTCIVENYLKKDGSIKIPQVLWKYFGKKEISAPLSS
ncbi:serine--tRNA ligase [Patescibacteria group bacterium]|nr:serine--tRNA ligase [Patescibacteria group bacterium]